MTIQPTKKLEDRYYKTEYFSNEKEALEYMRGLNYGLIGFPQLIQFYGEEKWCVKVYWQF